jgi:hypothetical protein
MDHHAATRREGLIVGKKILMGVPLVWIVIATPAMAETQSLGRLFFTPAERAALDRAQAGVPVDEESIPAVTKRPAQVNGYVSRSDGKATVWLDGDPRYRRESVGKISPSSVQTATPIIVRRSTGLPQGK